MPAGSPSPTPLPPDTAIWGQIFHFGSEGHFGPRRNRQQWVREASWFQGKAPPSWEIGGKGLSEFQGKPGGDGRWFFVTGGSWLIRKGAVDALDWPDPRLVKETDDVMLGEAIRQQGWRLGDTCGFGIAINMAKRRGEAGQPIMTRRSAPVEVVILNWRRPENVREIIYAFADQYDDCTVTVIDAAGSPEYALDQETLEFADRHFVFSHNFGSFNRFVPLLGYSSEFTLFHDDDLLPGPRAVAHLLETARRQPDFAVLGEIGRRVTRDDREGVRDVPRFRRACRRVDFIIRSYFVRTADLRHFAARCLSPEFPREHCEDDLLLSASLQQATGRPCLVTPDAGPESRLAMEYLPEPFALWHREQHFPRRAAFIRQLIAGGWETMARRRTRQRSALSPA